MSNESAVNVFFDNLQLVHTRSQLLEETHYYPFGLTMAGISCKVKDVINKLKFNEATELASREFSDGSGLELYETKFRGYDHQIGRFWQIDPLAEFHVDLTSYAYVGNNPLLFNDPLGLDTVRVWGPDAKKIKIRNGDILEWKDGDKTSYYKYDPNNPDAVNGFVGQGVDEGENDAVVVVSRKKGSNNPYELPMWFDPFLGGAEYQLGKTLERYKLDGYGSGRPLLPGPAQRVFDRSFPKGSYGRTRPVNIHLPAVGRSIQVPRYVVSATGQVLKFTGIASSVYGTWSTERLARAGEISEVHRWTNHAMTVISYLGPGGLVVSLVYSIIGEELLFNSGPGYDALENQMATSMLERGFQ